MKLKLLFAIGLLALALGVPSSALAAPPANDAFANATVIDPSALPFSDVVDNPSATTEPGEPSGNCITTQHTVLDHADQQRHASGRHVSERFLRQQLLDLHGHRIGALRPRIRRLWILRQFRELPRLGEHDVLRAGGKQLLHERRHAAPERQLSAAAG